MDEQIIIPDQNNIRKFSRKTEENLEERLLKAKEKHGIKSDHDFMSQDEFEKQEQEKKQREAEIVARFNWDRPEKEEVEATEFQPDLSDEEITSAANVVVDYITKNMSLNDYDPNNWTMVVKVPKIVHKVLEERFNETYAFESRLAQIERLKDMFPEFCSSDETKAKFNQKLLELFPQSGDWKVSEKIDTDMVIPDKTVTPASLWEFTNAFLDDEDDLCMDTTNEKQDDSVFVTLEIAKADES